MNNSLSGIAADNWDTARKLLAAGLVIGSIYLSVLAAMWFIGDFIAMAVGSPNLDEATQVADFNDFSYISEALRSYRFNLGAIVLTMAIAMVMQAVLLLQPRSLSSALFIVGGIAMLLQVTLLNKVFYWPVFLFFILTALGLYLTAELGSRGLDEVGEEGEEIETEADVEEAEEQWSIEKTDSAEREDPPVETEPPLSDPESDSTAPSVQQAKAKSAPDMTDFDIRVDKE